MTEVFDREALAAMMLRQSIATGHGDTFVALLSELEAWIVEGRTMANVYEGEPDARQLSDQPPQPPVGRFRPRYRQLKPEELVQHDALKAAYEAVERLVVQLPAGRYRALALTTLEESCMWAVKELTA